METRTIKILPLDELGIIKQINLVSESKFHNEAGYILYERKLTPNYKFIKVPENKKDFKYYMEYPGQELFPNDDLDNLILLSIRNFYSKSVVRNYPLLSNVDIDNLTILKNRYAYQTTIRITPNFSNVDILKLRGLSFKQIILNVNVYTTLTSKDVENMAFFGYYSLDDEDVLERLTNEVLFV
ncbi:hypothetical protein EZS27_024959 [termite gut metagenome]|uniref:Uncharacterized protein n=1 Tax=termite gut metagenome TaxID=433724 RepID=A0A5J4QVC0_9ZZZZ